MRRSLYLGPAIAMALSTSLVAAQDAAVAPDSTSRDVGGAGLEEVVVTAQRKEETLQRAGIAIDVVTGDKLIAQGLSDASGLGTLVPSLNAQNLGGANAVFFLRGVGNFTVNGYSDPAIAFNYDGVYLGRPTSTSGVYYDLERMEVLKGPQGTLYGRNATAGAINIIPARPKLGEFAGVVNASYGNYDAFNVQAALNLPLGERTAVRIASNAVGRDGYLSDDTSDEKTQAARLQLLTELTDRVTLRVGADYSHSDGEGAGSTYAGRFNFDRTSGSYAFVPAGFDASVGLRDAAAQAYRQTLFVGLSGRTLDPLDPDLYLDNDFHGVNAELTWETDAGTLTLLPAWRSARLDYKFALPAFVGFIQEDDEQFSFEARFNGRSVGMFDYILGGYYYDETVEGNYTFAQSALNAYQEFESKIESYAAFGRLTANLSDRFRLIGGLRYTQDNKQFDGQADVLIVGCTTVVAGRPSCPTVPLLPVTDHFTELQAPYIIPPPGQARPIGATGALLIRATTPVDADLDKGKLTYRAAAEFDLTPASLLYASVETGYRSGGFALSAGYETFAPEYIDAYTIGMKNRLLDNRMQLNVEGFVWKYRDQQVNHSGIDRNGNQGQFTENVGRSTNQGIEADLQLLATESTLLSVTAQYLDATYDSFVYSEPVGATPPLTGCAYALNANNPALYDIDCSGQPAYQSPKWTVNLGVQQTIPLGGYKLVGAVDTQYKSQRAVAFEYLDYQIVDDTWTTNAQLIFGETDERWSVAAYVRNIEDDRFVTSAQLFKLGQTGLVTTAAPRTYGVRATMKF